MTTHKPNPIALAIAERLYKLANRPIELTIETKQVYEGTFGTTFTIANTDATYIYFANLFETGQFDNLLPDPAWPVLSVDPGTELLVDGLVNDAIRKNEKRSPLLPNPTRPVLSDETIDWLYVHCDLFDVSRPLSSAIDDGGKVPLTPMATKLRDELRAWEEWRESKEG